MLPPIPLPAVPANSAAPAAEETAAAAPVLAPPPAPRRRRHFRRKAAVPIESCLNCDRPRVHPEYAFCPACGQQYRHSGVSLSEMFGDLWEEFARVDSKLLKSVTALLFRPGLLTREYVSGRRARYIAPFKLYLAASFFFFTALAWQTQGDLAQKLTQKRDDLTRQITAFPSGKSKNPKGEAVHIDFGSGKTRTVKLSDTPATLQAYQAAQKRLPATERDDNAVRFLKYMMIRFRYGDPAAMIGGVLDAASKMMFFLLPVYALFLKLLYWRSDRRYAAHFVYALHVHSVAFLLLMASLLLPDTTPVVLILSGAFVVYSIQSLRFVYGQGIFKTLFKLFLLANWYLSVIVIALTLTVLASLAAQSGFLASLRSML